MPTQKRLFLLDAFALIFRGYYALIKNPRINSKGMDTSAILGFTNSLLDVIKREKPDLLAVAFDKGGSHARKEAFPEYKSNRQETPEAIKIAVPYIQEILKAMNIPIVEVAGFEADDLIGTLAKQAEKEGFQTFMVTPDKDFAQLVSENIFMYKPARMGNGIEIWGIPEVQKRFEVETPLQVIDYLGMMGDAVDNIPGLPGVGDKTAKKFIKAYGSMEGLLENTHELKGKMKEKVEANKDLGILSKQLATIMLDCPVTFHAKDYELTAPNFEAVNSILQDLEFKRIADSIGRIFKAKKSTESTENEAVENTKVVRPNGDAQLDLFGAPASESTTISSGFNTLEKNAHFYQYIDSDLAKSLFLKKLSQQTSVSFELETSEQNPLTATILGIGFSYHAGSGYYIPFPSDFDKAVALVQELKPFFEDDNIEKIGRHLKNDIKVLSRYNTALNGTIFDTTIAHYLLQPDMRHNLDILSENYLKYEMTTEDTVVGKGRNKIQLNDVSLEKQRNYVVEKADVIFQLKSIFEEKLKEKNLSSLYKDIELPLLKVLAQMELEGIRLDVPFLNSLSSDLNKDITVLEKSIYEEADTDFNLASPKQLGVVLFEHMKLVEKPKKTKTGQYATGEEILSKLAKDHPIVQRILDWRGLVKLKNTYVDALPNEVNDTTGRVHTTFSQAVAATGRLSSNNPNLQNIPIRTKRGQEVRKSFIAKDDNYTLVAADYSQIELRLIAAMSGDETMIKAFNDGHDIHAATAAKVFDVALEDVTRTQRSDAKAVNFGIIYGQGAFTLAQQLNKSRKEAKELIDNYYANFSKLKEYIAAQVEIARENGYVETVLGRRRYLKNINSQNAIVRSADERNAVNAPVQGSAADIIKIAMINIQKLLNDGDYKTKMLLQVHDELVFDMHNDEMDELKPLIKNAMESAYKMAVPLDVDMGEGRNWLEAH